MERIPVVSSNLRSVGYDPTSQILEIEFNSGSVYRYFQVPKQIYEALMKAPSHGKYFYKYIRNSQYQYKKVRS